MMLALDPTTFLVSTTIVGIAILLMMVVSRPGLAEDRPVLMWWIVGEVFQSLHNFILLISQPAVFRFDSNELFGLTAADAGRLSFLCLIFSLSCGVKSLRVLCQTRMSLTATVTLLAGPALAFSVAIHLVSTIDEQLCVIMGFAISLTLLQMTAAWPGLSQSLGLRILTSVNGVIVVLALVGFSHIVASLLWSAPNPPHGTENGEFRPGILGMLCVFLSSIITAFSLSLVMQERQRAFIIKLSTTDLLTGTFNRRGAMPLMTQALEIAHRREESVSIALIDIDHFKQVNDRLGHEAGDAVLRVFAGTVAAGKRECDLLARWGGEEFLMLLPGTDHAAAEATLERLREEMPALVAANAPCGVTFSAGIVTVSPSSVAPMLDRIIDHADRCLYRAKMTRNRVVAETLHQGPEDRRAA